MSETKRAKSTITKEKANELMLELQDMADTSKDFSEFLHKVNNTPYILQLLKALFYYNYLSFSEFFIKYKTQNSKNKAN